MDHVTLDTKIAQQIATHEGIDVTELNPPLYDEVDLEALEKLLCPRPHERTAFVGTVTFDYCGKTVAVDQTGAVTVTSPDGRSSTSDSATDRSESIFA
jgi:hypothetical protein